MTARIFNVLAGLWLFITVFMWPHTSAQGMNAAVCGIAAMGLGLLALYLDSARYLSAALGAWVFISTFLFPGTRMTTWNNALIGIAMFVASLLGSGPVDVRRERELYGRA
jgi:Na+-transporting NADH:ubiquinone oxidoreductase subunit NqrB